MERMDTIKIGPEGESLFFCVKLGHLQMKKKKSQDSESAHYRAHPFG